MAVVTFAALVIEQDAEPAGPSVKQRDLKVCVAGETGEDIRQIRIWMIEPSSNIGNSLAPLARRGVRGKPPGKGINGLRGRDQRRVERARSLRRPLTPAEFALWTRFRARQLGSFKFVRQEPIGATPRTPPFPRPRATGSKE